LSLPERVLNEIERVEDDFSDQLNALRRTGMIDRPLKNTAAVSMSSHLDEVSSDGVVDELVILGHELVQAFLNHLYRYEHTSYHDLFTHMVAVEILDQSNDVHA